MYSSKIAGVGHYVPERIITNQHLSTLMDTNDEWITERTGIKERRYFEKGKDTVSNMAMRAADIALERAGCPKSAVDFIVFATITPDYFFPGSGVLLQRDMGLGHIGALDIRNQCSGFVYALSVADQYIKTGMYQNILVIGAEIQSSAIDFSNAGRSVAVIFCDGAGAVLLQRATQPGQHSGVPPHPHL
jgi:3-oxoacyl-[acyl-carrier-protein] synthase-3